jgi:hypothetical protein
MKRWRKIVLACFEQFHGILIWFVHDRQWYSEVVRLAVLSEKVEFFENDERHLIQTSRS